jgi:hypothetical protein
MIRKFGQMSKLGQYVYVVASLGDYEGVFAHIVKSVDFCAIINQKVHQSD